MHKASPLTLACPVEKQAQRHERHQAMFRPPVERHTPMAKRSVTNENQHENVCIHLVIATLCYLFEVTRDVPKWESTATCN